MKLSTADATELATLQQRARHELATHQFQSASRTLAVILKLQPHDPLALKMMGMAAQRLEDHERAVRCFRAAVKTWPNDGILHTGLAISLSALGTSDEAIVEFRAACAISPDFAPAWFNLGEALARESHAADAVSALDRALIINPDYLDARLSLARVHVNLGQLQNAVAAFREVLRLDAGNADAWFGLSYLNVGCLTAADVPPLRCMIMQSNRPKREREMLGFALAKALESGGDYDQAFEAFTFANELGRERVAWKPAAERSRVRAIRDAFSDEMRATLPANAQYGREVILIASLPRSGSTLVEQILASHPEVEGANEIRCLSQILHEEGHRRHSSFPAWTHSAAPTDWHRLGAEYMARTERWHATKPRFVDKSLQNWLFVGAALAMLPAARVVIIQRDPLETCLACYRQCLEDESGFSCDLDHMTDYCADFIGLSRFWCNKFPDRVLHFQYEDLLAAPEAAVRRLLDFCGLPFDAACMASHRTQRVVQSLPSAVQVRQPLQGDTARVQRYGKKLDRLRQRLISALAAADSEARG